MLFSLKPENLYQFFMKATQLEEVLQWYGEAKEDLVSARDCLERKAAQRDNHCKALKKMEKRHKQYQQIDEQKHGMYE